MSEYYVNIGYLSAGDKMLDGSPVPDATAEDGKENIRHARDVCNAYHRIATANIDHFISAVSGNHTGAWFSDSQATPILLGEGGREDTVQEDFRIALEMMKVVDAIFDDSLLSDSPLGCVQRVRNDVKKAIQKMSDPEKVVKSLRKNGCSDLADRMSEVYGLE